MIKIISENGTTWGTKIIDEETGADLAKFATGLFISMKSADSLVEATIHLSMIELEATADGAKYAIPDPLTGMPREVAQIVFADGAIVDFSAGVPKTLTDLDSGIVVKTLGHSAKYRNKSTG